MIENNLIRIVDLFGGVGGFRYAADRYFNKKNISVECVLYAEKDKFARKTYFSNWNDQENWTDDIKKIVNGDILDLPEFNILFAGFPCQPFSIMGRGKGFNDERGELFFYIEKIIRKYKPDFFMLENVARIETINKRETYNTIQNILTEKLGYNLVIYKLNSFDYGVNQIRRRIYFCGFKKKLSETEKMKLKKTLVYREIPQKIFLEKDVDQKYYLSEKIKNTILKDSSGLWKSRAEINKIPARPLVKTMHKMHRASQDNYYSDDFIKKLYDDNYIPNENDKKRIRRITPKEAFRLQGFDDIFVNNAINEGISDTQLYMQAGNAVSVPVIETLLEHIFSIVYNL